MSSSRSLQFFSSFFFFLLPHYEAPIQKQLEKRLPTLGTARSSLLIKASHQDSKEVNR